MPPFAPFKTSLKRKAKSKFLPSKRTRIQCNFDRLPWKSVARPSEAGLHGDDGILELEEVEGVDVVYDDTSSGRVVKFNVVGEICAKEQAGLEDAPNTEQDMYGASHINYDSAFNSDNLLPEWNRVPLHEKLKLALHEKGFIKPTPIQAAAVPVALEKRDVIGVAQTGSGKTLAYGLPILNFLLSLPRPSFTHKRLLRALILAPTRELALQISSHLNSVMTSIEFKKGGNPATGTTSKSHKPPPHVSIAAVVGGMSSQKQRRLLDRGLDILVATPGRLWDVLQEDDGLAQEIRTLQFLVLDEADRMIEAGHFAELENILRLTLRESLEDRLPDHDGVTMRATKSDEMQTFVFSATLSKELQRNLKIFRQGNRRKYHKHDTKPASTLDDLLLRLDFRDAKPEVIDLSPVGGMVSTLQEARIECLSGDKDVYLYYFLLRHPGKTLVFLSSVDGIRRLMPLVETLNIKAFTLHSQLEQRQRLKHLDRFTNTHNSVLLATDIAARGLDIPTVDHVIHFQIPRTADTYIHRNGRTARAMQKGFSMLMVAPDERRVVKALLGSLKRDEAEVSDMFIDLSILDKLKARVQLARKIETAQHKIKKANHDQRWMKETADALGVVLDDDIVDQSVDQESQTTFKRKQQNKQLSAMKAELRAMLSQPLISRGISTKFITSGSRRIVDDLLTGDVNETMLGLKNIDAGTELVQRKGRKKHGKTEIIARNAGEAN